MGDRKPTKQFMKSFRGSNTDNYNPFMSRNYHEGRECEPDYLDTSGITEPFSRSLCFSFAHNLLKLIFPHHLQEFYANYRFDRDNCTLHFKMYGYNYAWNLEKLGTVLNISSEGRLFYTDGTHTNEFDKYNRYHPNDVNYIDASLIQTTILKRQRQGETPLQHHWDASDLKEKFKLWESVLTTNVFVKMGSRGNLSVIVGYMLYCIETNTPFNFAYFMENRIAVEHGASSSQSQQMNPEEQIESEINSWFEQTTLDEAEREISSDDVLGKEEEENLSFGDRMAYKSYLSTKRQHRESRTKMVVLKNFIKRWAKSMSCKDI
ncbi:hypothetical protein Tco_1193076 [Tanacetum coccineum]